MTPRETQLIPSRLAKPSPVSVAIMRNSPNSSDHAMLSDNAIVLGVLVQTTPSKL
jgi:hypothetical protein